MQLPRFTTRRLMAIVARVAVVCGVIATPAPKKHERSVALIYGRGFVLFGVLAVADALDGRSRESDDPPLN
jgi:hypothetical protein